MRRPILALALIACSALPASAGEANGDFARLFTQSCLAYPDSPARLRVWLDTHLTPAEESRQGFFLGKHTGRVWFDRTASRNFAVVLFDDGRCGADADIVLPDDAMTAFEAEAAKAGFKVAVSKDEPHGSFHGASGHVRAYGVGRLGHEYTVRAAGTTLPTALLHSELMLEHHS